MGVRSDHHEYVCTACGHPLLFASESLYAWRGEFHKQVRYLCNLFGHDAHLVGQRAGFDEYACHCGHSFLRRGRVKGKLRHPLVCFFAGHFITRLGKRWGAVEYCCRNCGHTFYF
jgi:hypothetical protein